MEHKKKETGIGSDYPRVYACFLLEEFLAWGDSINNAIQRETNDKITETQ